VQAWKDSVGRGDLAAVVQDLLLTHYDPVYVESMQRNFSQFAHALDVVPDGRSASAMDAAAAQLRGLAV
jgi:tRNA 2-selenouridine synthase